MRMFFTNAERLRERAAEKTLAHIDTDAARAPAALSQALAYIREHLFEEGLDVNRLWRALGLRGHSFGGRFEEGVGLTPRRYIEERRLETAKRLLRDTTLSADQLSELIGYAQLSTFSRAFARWAGMSPIAYRRQATAVVPPPEGSGAISVDDLRRVIVFETAPLPDVQRVLAKVQAVYERRRLTEQPAPPAGAGLSIDSARAEEIRADALWQALESCAPELQRRVATAAVFRTPAVFDLLRSASRVAGRSDRARGLGLAELGLVAAGYDPDIVPADAKLAGLQARAWSWLAIVRRQNDDYLAAEEAIERAEALRLRAVNDALVHGEVLHAHADLRMSQWRLRQARDLQKEAVDHLRCARPAGHALVRSLVQLGNVHYHLRDSDRALAAYVEARHSIDAGMDPYLDLVITKNLAGGLRSAGRNAEANVTLEKADLLAQEIDAKENRWKIVWERGLAAWLGRDHADAETLLRKARSAFDRNGYRTLSAFLAVDLSLLLSEVARDEEAASLLAEALCHSKSLDVSRYLRQRRRMFYSRS